MNGSDHGARQIERYQTNARPNNRNTPMQFVNSATTHYNTKLRNDPQRIGVGNGIH